MSELANGLFVQIKAFRNFKNSLFFMDNLLIWFLLNFIKWFFKIYQKRVLYWCTNHGRQRSNLFPRTSSHNFHIKPYSLDNLKNYTNKNTKYQKLIHKKLWIFKVWKCLNTCTIKQNKAHASIFFVQNKYVKKLKHSNDILVRLYFQPWFPYHVILAGYILKNYTKPKEESNHKFMNF